MSLEAALETIGIGRFHYQILFTGGLILYTANSDNYSIGYAISSAECELALDLNKKTILMSAGCAGIMSMQFFWGYIADKVGRRRVLANTLLLGFLCSMFSALVPSFWLLATFRYLNGVFVAASSSLTFAYVSEFFPAKQRSVAILIISVFVGVVLVMIPLWAWLIVANQFQLHFLGAHLRPWRVYLLVSGSSGLVACCAMFFCPESPKFLVQAGRPEDALKVLNVMHKQNKAQGPGVSGNLCDGMAVKEVNVLELVQRKYIWKTLLVCGLQLGVFATSCGLFLWYPDIVQRISTSTKDVTVCQALDSNEPVANYYAVNRTDIDIASDDCIVLIDDSVYLQNIFIGMAYTIGYVVISALIRKIGIRNILVSFLGVSGLATFALLFVAQYQVVNVLFVLLLALSGICIVVVNAAVVDLYPTHMRGMAVSIAMLSGSFGSIAASSLVGYLLLWNCQVTFIIFGISLICCALMSILLSFCTRCDE